MEEKKECAVWKVLLIIGAIIGGVIAVIAVALKLYSKYCLIDEAIISDEDEEDESLLDADADDVPVEDAEEVDSDPADTTTVDAE